MIRLLLIIGCMTIVAFLAQTESGNRLNFWCYIDIAIYALFVGLRTSYNDTGAYIKSFVLAPKVSEFVQNSDSMNVLHNPLFYYINAQFHEWTNNYHVFFLIFAIVDAWLLIRFIRKYGQGETFYCVLLFWGFGLGMFGAAAMKQITAMAVLTLAYELLLKKKYIFYVAVVLFASLIHTYAILFLMLPFFKSKPWSWQTLLIILGTMVVLLTFNDSISLLLDYADAAGKSVADFEVFDGVKMNIFRVAVYGICPVSSLVFRKSLFPECRNNDVNINLLCNMSIIGFMFILMGSMNGANMFGRLATYFVLGDICILGWILQEVFEARSYRFIQVISIVLFIVFIMYDNKNISDPGGYAAISLWEFIFGVI